MQLDMSPSIGLVKWRLSLVADSAVDWARIIAGRQGGLCHGSVMAARTVAHTCQTCAGAVLAQPPCASWQGSCRTVSCCPHLACTS